MDIAKIFTHARHKGDDGPNLKKYRRVGYIGGGKDRQALIEDCPRDFEIQIGVDDPQTFCMAVAPGKATGFIERWVRHSVPRRVELTAEQCSMPFEDAIAAVRGVLTEGDILATEFL